MFSTTAIALAFVASTQANALFPNVDDKNDFNLDDECAKINIDDDDECLTSLVDLQLNQNNVDAEADAKQGLQNDRREFDRQRLVAARGLEAAINALNANPNSKALIGWCQNEVKKIAKRERVGINVDECTAICGQVKRGRDAAEAFECVRDKLQEKGKENAEGEDFQSIVDIRDAQFNQQAFFVATFEAEEEDQFDEVLFGEDAANFEAQEAQFALLTSTFQEANEIVEDDDDEGSDIEDFAEAFFEAVEDDEDFQETISDIEDLTEVINFGNLFNLINERSALPAVVDSTVTVMEIEDADDDDLEEIEQEIAAFLPTFEFVAVGASSNKREVSEGTILLAHAADSDDERRLNDILIQSFCIDREITCTRIRIVDEAQVDLVEQFASSSSTEVLKKGDKGWVDPKDDDWKPAHDPHAGHDDGYGNNNKKTEESTERDSDEEDDDNAGSIAAIAVSAVLAAATMFM